MAKMHKKIVLKNLMISSSIDLTLSDRRLFNYLLHNAFHDLPRRLEFEIAFAELEGVYGTGLPPIDRLKESVRRLIRTLIEFEINNKWVICNLLESAEVFKSENRLSYSYSIHCRQLFTDAFLLEKCLIQAHFSQKYSKLLFEILSDARQEKLDTVSLEIADLRSQLNIPENKLSNYSDLERFVLTPATSEINSYASFAIKFDTQRKGMKVTHVIFTLTEKKNISAVKSAKEIIPPKRPRFFIEDPEIEKSYAYLLNAETKERRKFFDLAIKRAAKEKIILDEEIFDRPDLWFRWVQADLLKMSDPR